MRFPVSVKVFRGQLDVAAFTGVLMLLVVFLLLTRLVYTPGVRLQLPVANDLPGTDRPTIAVAVDALGRFYFENQLLPEAELRRRLRDVAARSSEPLTLVVQADQNVTHRVLMRLAVLARDAGINDALLAVLPAPFAPPAAATAPP
jgi:biopolymer transport protein ExbD